MNGYGARQAAGVAFACAILVSGLTAGQQSATRPGGAGEVRRLVEQLGSSSYAQRQAAYKRLIEIGEPAIEALRAAASDKDPERAQRARQALAEVRENIIPPDTYRAKVTDFIASSDDAKRQGSWAWMQKRLARTVPYLLERTGKVTGVQAVRLRQVVFDAWKKEFLTEGQKTEFVGKSLRVAWRADQGRGPAGRRIAILDVSGLANMSPDRDCPSSPPWKFLKATWTAELDGGAIARGQTWGSDQTYVRLPEGLKPGRHKLKATVELAEIEGPWRWSTSSEAEITVPASAPPTPAAAPPASAATIAGRVVDEKGKPMPDVPISAKSSSMGQDLWWAFKAETRSDGKGHFALSVPFGDIVYQVVAGSCGVYHVSAPVRVVPSAAESVELALRPTADSYTVRGTVTGALDAPVPFVPVIFVGEYDRTCRTRTDKDGRFRVRTGELGQTVAVVRSGELVAPQKILKIGFRRKETVADIALAPASTLVGLVCDQEDRAPIAGATVLIRPWLANSFRMEARAGKDGRFRLEGIPPGRYAVAAEGPGYFQRLERGMEYPEVTLTSGQVKEFDMPLARAALVRGKVVDPAGRPVAGALVATQRLAVPDYREQYDYVKTAADGSFIISLGQFEKSLPLAAYSSRDGLATAQVKPLQAGQIADGLVLRLPGAASIKGRVTDPGGRPIKGVACSVEDVYTVSAVTGAHGRFDLGRVTLTARPELPRRIVFRAPRPGSGHPDERQQYYYHRVVSPKVSRDEALDLDVKLQPTQLLKFSGVVTDAKGAPLADARVWLLTGDATGDKWLDLVRPPELGGGIMIRSVASGTLLASTRTGKDGRWTIRTVRENGAGALLGGRGTDWTKYCLGIESKHLHVLVRGIVVPRENPVVALPVKLEEGGAKVREYAPRAPATQPGGDGAEIDRLIKQLGSDKFAERQAAQKALVEIGRPAVAALQSAAADKDAERAQRARAALRLILPDTTRPGAIAGMAVQNVDAKLLKASYSPPSAGAVVKSVAEASDAEKAGLKGLDVITAVNGRTVASAAELRVAIARLKPGDKVKLTVWRSGRELELAAPVGEWPKSDPEQMVVYPLRGANAAEVAKVLEQLLRTPRQPGMMVLADVAANAVIVIAADADQAVIADLIRQLDS